MLYVNEFKTFCVCVFCCLNGIPISSVVSSCVLKKDLWKTIRHETGMRDINEEEFMTKILKIRNIFFISRQETWRVRQFKLIVIVGRSELLTRLTFRPPFNYELSKIGVSTIYLKWNVISNSKPKLFGVIGSFSSYCVNHV